MYVYVCATYARIYVLVVGTVVVNFVVGMVTLFIFDVFFFAAIDVAIVGVVVTPQHS